jgi:NRAMP (natural resistance-associated macrophage protein)-like metal ion transporter
VTTYTASPARSQASKRSGWQILRRLGPGLVTGAADDDPSGIATYSQAGAQFGYGLLWTVFLTTPFMIAIQLVSARIGRVTGKGLAANIMEVAPRWIVLGLVFLLVGANTVNIAADIAAMGEALSLVIGGLNHEHALIFAATSTLLQVFVPYRRYSPVLKFLTLSLFAYVATAFTVTIPWSTALLAAVWPKASVNADYLLMIVAVLGTTISPYLFFWQASQEVEEIDVVEEREPLKKSPDQAADAEVRMRYDTFVGMAISNLVAIAIMLGTAATLHASGKTDIQTAADAAKALEPIAGQFAFALFSLGIIGTGMLAVPVLAGSTAYAIGETAGWKTGLEHKPRKAKLFYAVIGVAMALGVGIDWSPISPIKALFWSAVINGVVAVPILIGTMLVVSRRSTMGDFTASTMLKLFGWASTAVMAAAVIGMAVLPG